MRAFRAREGARGGNEMRAARAKRESPGSVLPGFSNAAVW
jgi:hypothetical protein